MSMFVMGKNMKSNEEKVVFSVIYFPFPSLYFLLFKCCYCPFLFMSGWGVWNSDMKMCRIISFTVFLNFIFHKVVLLLTQHLLVWQLHFHVLLDILFCSRWGMESNLVAEFIAETGADKTVAYSYLQGTSVIVWKFVSGYYTNTRIDQYWSEV